MVRLLHWSHMLRERIVRRITLPHDSSELRLQKSLLVLIVSLIIVFGALWSILYAFFGRLGAASIPALYSCLSCLSLGLFLYTQGYALFRFTQTLLILVLPFGLHLGLGGFTSSGAVVLWSLLAPLGGLIFYNSLRRAGYWFAGYLGCLVLAGVLQPWFVTAPAIPWAESLLFFVLNLGAVSTICFVLLSYFMRQVHIEQDKADRLLLNVLPREIATILKNESRVIADQIDCASILFADVVNFTPLSASLTPAALVELLNEVFSHFDMLVEQYGLEKIKTIGDCYMVAAGVPQPRPDHAQVLVRLALEMQDYVASRAFAGQHLVFRMGIHSGPVVAGVIGRKRFIYDLWGDTVNTASRMESHGVAGAIQITRATYELIQDVFACNSGGVIPIKGKGSLEVWHVGGTKRAPSDAESGIRGGHSPFTAS